MHIDSLRTSYFYSSLRQIFIVLILLVVFSSSEAVSFDCRKSTFVAEQITCQIEDLGTLDDQLSNIYTTLLKKLSEQDIGYKALKSEQKKWMISKNKCEDPECVRTHYRNRIEELCIGYPTDTGINQFCTNKNYRNPPRAEQAIKDENVISARISKFDECAEKYLRFLSPDQINDFRTNPNSPHSQIINNSCAYEIKNQKRIAEQDRRDQLAKELQSRTPQEIPPTPNLGDNFEECAQKYLNFLTAEQISDFKTNPNSPYREIINSSCRLEGVNQTRIAAERERREQLARVDYENKENKAPLSSKPNLTPPIDSIYGKWHSNGGRAYEVLKDFPVNYDDISAVKHSGPIFIVLKPSMGSGYEGYLLRFAKKRDKIKVTATLHPDNQLVISSDVPGEYDFTLQGYAPGSFIDEYKKSYSNVYRFVNEIIRLIDFLVLKLSSFVTSTEAQPESESFEETRRFFTNIISLFITLMSVYVLARK